MLIKRLLTCMLLCATTTVGAQAPSLVEDIWKGNKPSNPGPFIKYNNELYFYDSDSAHGREMWKWSGSAMMIADTYPGSYSSGTSVSQVADMAVFNNKLYYPGLPATGQNTLLMYDGVNPPAPAPGFASFNRVRPHWLNLCGSKLYFIGDTGTAANACLFSYDGTNPPVVHKSVGSAVSVNEQPHIIYYKGKVIFEADSNGVGREVFVLDPVTNQCHMLADIYPGTMSSNPGQFIVAGSKLYFKAVDPVNGIQLYSYDGAALVRVTSSASGFQGATFGGGNAFYKGAIYFRGNITATHTALFKFDTASGITTLIKDVNPSGDAVIAQLIATPNNLYFCGKTASAGIELWKYNGTTCAMVADLNPGTGNGAGLSNMVPFEGGLYYCGNNGVTGNELYRVLDLPSSSGIQNLKWDGEVRTYPNPATAFVTLSITLQSPQSLRIALTDITGKEVFCTGVQSFISGKTDVKLPLQSLVAGQYFYRISGNGGVTLSSGAIVRL